MHPTASSESVLLAEVVRGDYVESRHFGHVAVVDAAGVLLWSAGDPERLTFPRSSLKPIQALAGVRRGTAERYRFTDAELAITCASHAAEPRHREAVGRILSRIHARESDLHCGPHEVSHVPSRNELILAGREPTPIYNNCSGKHSGMLALARVLGVPLTGYWLSDHPVQTEIQDVLRLVCGLPAGVPPFGTDGCGVPTYLMSLRRLALGFARMADPGRLPPADAAAARRITAAMNAEPEMVRGEGGFDSVLMRALPGVLFAKGGAEGCQCVGILGRGLGIAVKVEDGSARPLASVTLSVLAALGALPEELPETLRSLIEPVQLNTRGTPVGLVRSVVLPHLTAV